MTGINDALARNPKLGACIQCAALISQDPPIDGPHAPYTICGACRRRMEQGFTASGAPRNPKTGAPYAPTSKTARDHRRHTVYMLEAKAMNTLGRHHEAIFGFWPQSLTRGSEVRKHLDS